jgi:PAS domain S-box-containing protein
MHSTRHLVVSLFAVALVCALGPFAMEQIGFQFLPLELGGVGDHFAGYRLGDTLLRLDLILMFAGALGPALYLALRRSQSGNRVTVLLASSLAMAAVVSSVQIVRLPAAAAAACCLEDQVFHASQFGTFFGCLVILAGCVAIRMQDRAPRWPLNIALAVVGAGALVASLHAQSARLGAAADSAMHLAPLAAMAACVLMLRPELARRPTPVYIISLLAGLAPLAAAQASFALPGHDADTASLNRTAVLQWCAYLIPLLGLTVDLARGVADLTRERERNYLRRVIDGLPDPVYVRDIEGRVHLLNTSAAAFLGGSPALFEGRHLSECGLDPSYTRRTLLGDREVLATGKRRHNPGVEQFDADGRVRWMQTSLQPLPEDDSPPDQVLAVSTDVSDLKNAETALEDRLLGEKTLRECLARLVRSQAEEFDAAMDDVMRMVGGYCQADSVFIYRIDREDGVATRLCMWDGGGSPARPAYELSGLHWALPHLATGDTLVISPDEKRTPNARARATAADLDARFLMLAPVFGVDGMLWGIIGAHRPDAPADDGQGFRRVLSGLADLYMGARARVLAETDLQHAKDVAEAGSRAKSEFLANMSHEIRTPLNAVIGLADILKGLGPTPEQSHYLQMIHQAGDSLLGVINDILDFSKIEAGQLTLDPVDIELAGLMAEVVDLMAFHAHQQGLELVYHLSRSARIGVTVDPLRLKQVLLNLLNNAIKFTEEGHVALRVSRDNEGSVRFVVADTGIGIAPDKLAAVFDKFTQADASHTRKYGGTGLGLAISRNLVELMGGAIEAASKPGRGTQFTVTIPLAVADVPDQPILPDPRLTGRRHLSVLPDAAARACVASYLEDLGVTGLATGDAMQVVARLPDSGADVVLIDNTADPMHIDAVRHAVADLPPDDRPALMLVTLLGDERRDDELRRDGWAGVIHKPARRATLRRALYAVLHPDTAPPDSAEDPGAHATASARVLLVEDNVFNQKVATRLLESLGCDVTVAENGREAVDLAGDAAFDLVLMDCQMPVMDGLEATRLIRRLGHGHGDVPIVAMTANVMGEYRAECLDAGMDDFASKPVTRKALEDLVATWGAVRSGAQPALPV